MNVVWTILIGLCAGVVAKWIHPGKERLGIVMTILLGIAGSVVATYGGQALKLYEPGQTAGFIGAVVGAINGAFLVGLADAGRHEWRFSRARWPSAVGMEHAGRGTIRMQAGGCYGRTGADT